MNFLYLFFFILLFSSTTFSVYAFQTSGESGTGRALEIDSLFEEYNKPDVPGASVMVIKNGKVVFKKAYGLANLEEKIPATSKTNYRLASNTKQFTAMAIMMLAERKKLSYESRLTDFFPNFPSYGNQITVRHLLNHTSGLIDYTDLITPGTVKPLADEDVLNLMKQQDHTYFPPGTKFRYSNSGYALLGLIVEIASGIKFPKFLKKNIFDPLHMTNTTFYDREARARDRAYGYTKQENGFERTDQSLTSSILGDGSIYSSVEDLYKWDQALYTTKLVTAKTLEQAFTPAVMMDETVGYGFGWFIGTIQGRKRIFHGGSTIGFKSHIERLPEEKLTVIVLINRKDAIPAKLARQIADLYRVK